MLHQTWFSSLFEIFLTFFIDTGQLFKLIVDVASAAGTNLRVQTTHERLLALGPVRWLQRVVHIRDYFVQEGLAWRNRSFNLRFTSDR